MHDLGAPRAKYAATDAAPAPHPPQSVPRRRSKVGRWFDSLIYSLGMAFVLFIIIRTFLIEAFQIPSGSMERTLLAGDFLFVNKAVYGAQIPGTSARMPGFNTPQRGDIIVFAFPRDPAVNYVKRVIGAPGDTVEMRGGRVYVNAAALEEPYVQRTPRLRDSFEADFGWQRAALIDRTPEERLRYHPTRDTWGPLLVPAGKYFVLGDNRDNSYDSRYWGFVDATAVKGRPLVVYFSYDRGAQDPLPWLMDIRWDRLGSLIH